MESESETQKSSLERQLVVFKINEEEFGVDINDVREIIRMGEITQIPNVDDYILGVINLRGKIIVIIDLAKRLKLNNSKDNGNTRIIITEVEGNTLGMVVDSCNEVLRLPSEKIEPAPPAITQKIHSLFINGVGILDERLIILLNLGEVIGSDELEKINKVKDKHAPEEISDASSAEKKIISEEKKPKPSSPKKDAKKTKAPAKKK